MIDSPECIWTRKQIICVCFIFFRYTSTWEYECIDLNEMVMTQGWIKDNVMEGTPIKVARIFMEVATLPGDELFIDNLFIGSDNDNCKWVCLRVLC